MLSEDILKVHFFIFRLVGIWAPDNAGCLYSFWQIISLIVIGIGLPLSFMMSFIYTESSEEALKIPVLLCTIISISIKCILIYLKNSRIREMLDVLQKMDNYAETSSISNMHVRLVRLVDIL